MAREYNSSQSTCGPDLVPDTLHSGLSPGVFPSDDACSSTDERKLESNFFATHSDSLPSKEGSSIEECNSMTEDGSSSAMPKKSAWNKPFPHGVVSEVPVAVMGADSWPALSELGRAFPKSNATYPPKSVSNGPIIPLQGMELGSSSSSTLKKVGFHSPTQKRAGGVGDGHGAGGSSTHTNMLPDGSLSPEVSYQGSIKEVLSSPHAGGSVGELTKDAENDGGQKIASHGRNERQQPQHNGSVRNNSPRFRGNGSYHHTNAGRRDSHRCFNSWGNHGPQQRGHRSLMHRPAPNTQIYVPQLSYPTMLPSFHLEVAHYAWRTPPDPWSLTLQPMYVPVSDPEFPLSPKILKPDPELPSKILNQIEYYFSVENLVRDIFLRKSMDAQGWVSINLIANFKKISELTDNIQAILDAIRASSVVEVQGDKVRRRQDWKRWIMSAHHSPLTSPHSNPSSSQNSLTDQLSNLNLD